MCLKQLITYYLVNKVAVLKNPNKFGFTEVFIVAFIGTFVLFIKRDKYTHEVCGNTTISGAKKTFTNTYGKGGLWI